MVRKTRKGKWKFVHRLVGAKKVHHKLLPSEEVHHIDKIRTDNDPHNLVVLKRGIHRHLHESRYNEKHTCFRCGRTSHLAKNCHAKTKFNGYKINYY